MKLAHIGIWTQDLEKMKAFYQNYFGMSCTEKYVNTKTKFSSYLLSFDGGAAIEIMHRPDISSHSGKKGIANGLAHISISVGTKLKVNRITECLRSEGFEVVGEPRLTGDGFYESVVLDPEGNPIEI